MAVTEGSIWQGQINASKFRINGNENTVGGAVLYFVCDTDSQASAYFSLDYHNSSHFFKAVDAAQNGNKLGPLIRGELSFGENGKVTNLYVAADLKTDLKTAVSVVQKVLGACGPEMLPTSLAIAFLESDANFSIVHTEENGLQVALQRT